MSRLPIILGPIFLLMVLFAGCGGGSSNSGVTQVVVSPTGLSLNSGQVVQISATPEDATGAGVATVTVTFATSNTSLVNVSPSGLVCAGTWDAQFIDCNGLDSNGNPLSGSATITASAGGISSSPVPVTIHINVTSVVVDQVAGCTSTTLTQQFTAHACSSIALPADTTGPCAPNAKEITSQIGSFTWGTIDPSVATVDSTGLVTAANPGLTGVFASASNSSSSPVAFTTCMPLEIRLHIQGQPDQSATLTQNQAITLESDMVDSNGFTKNSLTTIMASDAPIVGSIGGLSLTGSSFGGAGIMAACAPPDCGNGLNTPVYSNLFPVTVSGTSPAPMVYATTSFTPPAGTAPTLIPIDTSKSPPAIGTAVTLPGVANSMVFAANGQIAFLGTNAGLVSFSPAGATATLIDSSILGKVLAVSPDGSLVIVSNAAKDPEGNVIETDGPSQRVWAFQQASGGTAATQTFVKTGAVSAAINGDKFRTYIATNDGTGHIYVFSPLLSLQTLQITGGAQSGVAVLPEGSFVYIANGDGLDTLATCNNVKQPTTPSTNSTSTQLLQPVPNANVIVAVDSPGVDVETATVTSIFGENVPIPFNFTASNCQPKVTYSNQFINFGVGAFTANQLMVATNGSQIAVVPAGNADILLANPGGTPAAVPLPAGATQAFDGGMTPDGSQIWVGVGGTNTVEGIINGANSVHVATSFTKADGSAAPPDVVAVQPK